MFRVTIEEVVRTPNDKSHKGYDVYHGDIYQQTVVDLNVKDIISAVNRRTADEERDLFKASHRMVSHSEGGAQDPLR